MITHIYLLHETGEEIEEIRNAIREWYTQNQNARYSIQRETRRFEEIEKELVK